MRIEQHRSTIYMKLEIAAGFAGNTSRSDVYLRRIAEPYSNLVVQLGVGNVPDAAVRRGRL